jgi:flagellar M-ring protein FliF
MATNALSVPGENPAQTPAAPAGFSGMAKNPMASMGALFSQPAVRKSVPAIAALSLVGAAALAWVLVATPPQKMLFSNLADSDKAAVSEALTQANIANRIDPQSGTLTVGEDDYYRARMLLASQDLPKATPGGYAILDQLPMGVSRAVEGERLRQARETELARSIEEIEAVTEARVHLAMPETTVFVRDSAAPSASVIVRLAEGRSLGDAQVRSIINLVASSVPGMKAEAVTIVDGSGALLTKAGADSGTAAGDERIDFQRRVETKYRDQLTQLLTPLLGAGNFSAEVQADVNLDESQATREVYDKAGALRAEQGNWTGNQSEAGPPGGIPGTLSNTAPPATAVKAGEQAAIAPPMTATPTTTLKQSDQFARSYELDKEVSVTRAMPGTVSRLSVAVVLRNPEGAKPRSKAEIDQLTNLVRAAVGYDARRNDQVTVISRAFATNPADAEGPPWYDAGWVPMVARNVTALVIALLILLLGVRPLVAGLMRRRSSGGGVAAGEGERGAIGFAQSREPVSLEMLDSARSYDDRVTLVRDFTRDNPARAALAVRDMIRTDDKQEAR